MEDREKHGLPLRVLTRMHTDAQPDLALLGHCVPVFLTHAKKQASSLPSFHRSRNAYVDIHPFHTHTHTH